MAYPLGTNTIRGKARRTKLSAWDLALLTKLVGAELAKLDDMPKGQAYRSSVQDLHDRLLRAISGSLTEER